MIHARQIFTQFKYVWSTISHHRTKNWTNYKIFQFFVGTLTMHASLCIFLMHLLVTSNANKVYKMCIFLAQLHLSDRFAFPKKNKWKQTSTNCIRIEQECSVAVCETEYIRFILSWLGSPFSGYPIQCFFRILSLSNNESVRRTHEIWKGCVMCVCVRACLYSLCSAEIRCWKLKRNDFFSFVVMAWLVTK